MRPAEVFLAKKRGAEGTYKLLVLKRILPAFYDDNYVALLPGERRTIAIRYPKALTDARPTVTLRGWNVAETQVQ